MDKPLTYAQLDKRLRELGFQARTLNGKARVYDHETGASLMLPDTDFNAEVQWHHFVAARHVLDDYGLGDLDPVPNSRH